MNEYQEAIDFIKAYCPEIIDITNGKNYHIDVLQELVDKATPKKPIYAGKMTTIFTKEYSVDSCESILCPTCHKTIAKFGECCPNNDCRQAIDWSKDEI